MLVKMDEAAVEADKQVVFGSPITKHITFSSKFTDKQPLYILNGAVIEKTKMDALNPEEISNIEVLKDQSATGLYGDNAKNGVIRITTKNNFTNDPLKEPLFVLDGEFITKARLDAIGSDKIKSINVLKDASAIAKYGEKGSNGVIEITTKNRAGIDSNIDGNSVHLVVEEMPEFPGGKGALMNFIAANIKYPAQARADKVEGRVVVNFVVSPTGKVTNAKIVKGLGNRELNDEAIRIVSIMPDWKPGKEKGVAVNVSYTIPIEFKL